MYDERYVLCDALLQEFAKHREDCRDRDCAICNEVKLKLFIKKDRNSPCDCPFPPKKVGPGVEISRTLDETRDDSPPPNKYIEPPFIPDGVEPVVFGYDSIPIGWWKGCYNITLERGYGYKDIEISLLLGKMFSDNVTKKFSYVNRGEEMGHISLDLYIEFFGGEEQVYSFADKVRHMRHVMDVCIVKIEFEREL